MKKVFLFCGALLVMTSAVASAQLHFTATDCGGVHAASWGCTNNAGTAFTAVASCNAPPLTTLLAQAGVYELSFAIPVPDWWKMGTGYCRAGTAINVAYNGGAFSCIDYFGTVSASLGSNTYQIGPDPIGDANGPIDANRIRIRTVSAVDYDVALLTPPPTVGDEIFLTSIAVNKTKTVGTGACAGCLAPACFVFRQVTLSQPAGTPGGDPVIGLPNNFDYVSLQGGVGTDCPHSTPATRSSWGQIKSLYR